MFFPKAVLATALSLSLVLQAQGHAIFVTSEALATAAQRSDVTRAPACNAAKALANPAKASANGQFTVFAKNFNGGTDGATAVKSATLDTTGKGTSFPGKVTVVKNGNANPKGTETDQLTLQLPAGTKCTGGKCLVELASNAGFGNCVAVETTASAAAPAAAPAKNNNAGSTKSTTSSSDSKKTSDDSSSKSSTDSKKSSDDSSSKKPCSDDKTSANKNDTAAKKGDAKNDTAAKKGDAKKKHHHHKGAAAANMNKGAEKKKGGMKARMHARDFYSVHA